MAVLGIDIGTQSLKAALLDGTLDLLATADRPYRPDHPHPGWATQDPQLWLDALRPAIGEALARAGLAAGDVEAMSICGQLDGCVPADASGVALAPAIIWMDRRATAELTDIDPALVRERSGLVLDATHMAAKLRWMTRHLDAAQRVATWHQPVSFVVAALSGESAMSHSLASTTMLYSIADRRWDDDLLAAFGVAERTLPRLAGAAEIVGTLTAAGAALTGLPAGIPVTAGTGDDFSNPLGCGVFAPGIVAVSLGTAETVGALSPAPVVDPDLLVETHAYPSGLFHLGNPGWLSGGSVRWASTLLSVQSDTAFSALAATASPGCDGLVFIPALNGAMAPVWNAGVRGSFTGLATSHGPAHLARAVLEGTAFAMRDVVDRLAVLGLDTSRLRLMGGGARSALWCQIRADLTGRPADILVAGDASAIGAGLLAAVAVGQYPDIATAAAVLKHPMRRIEPDRSKAAIYDEAYGRYRARFAALEPVWG